MTQRDAGAVLTSEQLFFDHEAEQLSDAELRTPPHQMQRYRDARPRPTNIVKETLFSLLHPLEGKKALEYGCGFGENAVHLAYGGAQVTAFDLSPVSIHKAHSPAELLNLSHRIQFDVKEAGDTGYAPGSFDIVFGSAILHHLHTRLDEIYSEIDRLLNPTGVACFMEPVANSSTLQWLRRFTPVPCHATPDERQLTYVDFELLRSHGFRRLEYHHFYCFDRLQRLVGARLSPALRWMDYYAQRIFPPLKSCYGNLLVIAHRQ